MSVVQQVVGAALIVAGTGLIGTAAVGILRLPDVYHRTNAVAKAAALGVSLVLLGVSVLEPRPTTVVLMLLAIAAQLYTAPVAGYSIGRAAYRSGVRLAPGTYRNDLAEGIDPGARREPG